jgi:predicted SAM-dependent methyltransferase
VDGVLASHFLEHLDLQESWKFVAECYRVLKPGGVMVASVPNTSYFREVNHLDTKEMSDQLFGEQMDAGNPHTSFFDCALFFDEHKQALTEDSLWAILRKGGFTDIEKTCTGDVYYLLSDKLNRLVFSLTLWAVKK